MPEKYKTLHRTTAASPNEADGGERINLREIGGKKKKRSGRWGGGKNEAWVT